MHCIHRVDAHQGKEFQPVEVRLEPGAKRVVPRLLAVDLLEQIRHPQIGGTLGIAVKIPLDDPICPEETRTGGPSSAAAKLS